MNTATEFVAAKPVDFRRAQEAARSEAEIPAAFAATTTVPVAIGLLHLLSDVSPAAKGFLTLHTGIGPYSGKVLFGYLAGLLVAALWPLLGRRLSASPAWWLGVLLAGLCVGTALVFTPVVHWLTHLLR